MDCISIIKQFVWGQTMFDKQPQMLSCFDINSTETTASFITENKEKKAQS